MIISAELNSSEATVLKLILIREYEKECTRIKKAECRGSKAKTSEARQHHLGKVITKFGFMEEI